jgi:hypothetical protein
LERGGGGELVELDKGDAGGEEEERGDLEEGEWTFEEEGGEEGWSEEF